MANYLEIKQLLGKIFSVDNVIDEVSDIDIPELTYREETFVTSLSNSELRKAYDNMNNFSNEKVELFTSKHREVSLQFSSSIPLRFSSIITDIENGLTYTLGPASLEYCVFLLSKIVDNMETPDRNLPVELRHYGFMNLKRNFSRFPENPLELLPIILRAYTLKVDSTKDISIKKLRSCSISYEFQFMYKQSIAISENDDINNMFTFANSSLERVGRIHREQMDSPPKRIYNSDILDFYIMAIESRDPFTKYISFYHVIEYYFDAVFKKKLTDEIQNRITHPDFSYKNKDNLYELAKYIRKHMDSDDESGKGNEFESLKYVLNEYVPIDELKKRIEFLDRQAIKYYHDTDVPFANNNKKKTKIAWNDVTSVHATVANRLYQTRNALVHSKSEMIDNQYRPYKNANDLQREMALIRAVSELVIINSSSTI